MEMITVTDAKTHLLSLVKRTKNDRESFLLSLHGQPAALLVPPAPKAADTVGVVERMLSRRDHERPTLGADLTVRDLIEEGRQ
jgi:antitoxin (DNA-binding transcriptional repressor) of toxin-antitoxin stability system